VAEKQWLVKSEQCSVPCSLFPVPCSLFPVPCSLFPVPCSLVERTDMKKILIVATFVALALSGCCRTGTSGGESNALSPASSAQVESGVRAFMQTVAHDVTLDGPIAWRKHFAMSPAFFMAVNGSMAFADSAAATTGIQGAAQAIPHIELVWGNDLRVDPLTQELAVVATSWHEVQTNQAGKRVDSSGFFTGVAEQRDGRWQFRDAHWSEAEPPEPAK